MSEPKLILGPDGGDLLLLNGDLELSDGLETALILSMWGGNLKDNGATSGEKNQYWGNVIETNEYAKIRSKTQNVSNSVPLTVSALQLVRDAAASDLSWIDDSDLGEVKSIDADGAVKRIDITAEIDIFGAVYNSNLSATIES